MRNVRLSYDDYFL